MRDSSGYSIPHSQTAWTSSIHSIQKTQYLHIAWKPIFRIPTDGKVAVVRMTKNSQLFGLSIMVYDWQTGVGIKRLLFHQEFLWP